MNKLGWMWVEVGIACLKILCYNYRKQQQKKHQSG